MCMQMLYFFGEKNMIKRLREYYSKTEILIWSISSLLVIVSFFLFDRSNFLILSASLIGVTYLILNAKGNPLGQVLVILFSILYGIISFTFTYYGEMITYLGMTMPMAVFALISWLRNPFNGNRAEVTVGTISKAETVFMIALSAIVTVLFYFILQAFHTANKTKYDVFYHVADILYNFFCFKKKSYFFIFVIGIIAIILAAKSDSTVDFLIPFGKSVKWFDNKLEGHLYSIVITILLFISFAGNVLLKKSI